MKKIILTFLASSLFVLALLISPETSFAHGEAGLTFTSTTTEGRIVDVDYRDAYIEAGLMGRFDFGIFSDDSRQQQAKFTDIWVRIVREDGSRVGKTLFAGGIANQEFGGDGFSFVFPEGGTYTLHVRYNDADADEYGKETVGEAEFKLDVLRSTDEEKFAFGMEFWVGIVGGAALLAVISLPFLNRKKNESEL